MKFLRFCLHFLHLKIGQKETGNKQTDREPNKLIVSLLRQNYNASSTGNQLVFLSDSYDSDEGHKEIDNKVEGSEQVEDYSIRIYSDELFS